MLRRKKKKKHGSRVVCSWHIHESVLTDSCRAGKILFIMLQLQSSSPSIQTTSTERVNESPGLLVWNVSVLITKNCKSELSSTDDSDICIETVYHKARPTEHDTDPAKLDMRDIGISPHPSPISLSPGKPNSCLTKVSTSKFLKFYYKHSQFYSICSTPIYSSLICPTHFHILMEARN